MYQFPRARRALPVSGVENTDYLSFYKVALLISAFQNVKVTKYPTNRPGTRLVVSLIGKVVVWWLCPVAAMAIADAREQASGATLRCSLWLQQIIIDADNNTAAVSGLSASVLWELRSFSR